MKLLTIAALILMSLAIQAGLAFTGNPLLRSLILPLPMVLLAVGMVLWGFRPRTPRERRRDKQRRDKKEHVRQMRQILRERGIPARDPNRPVITVVEGYLPKDLERGADGAWRPKETVTDFILGEEGNWLIETKEKPGPVQVWEDFRVEVRQMIVEEVQSIMAAGWPFDSQLSKISPFDMLLAKRIVEQRAALKISQAVLGKLIGVSARTVSEWEHARRPIPPQVVNQLKRHLRIEQL
jgi:DNA-binding transcriptional regulator YiaG